MSLISKGTDRMKQKRTKNKENISVENGLRYERNVARNLQHVCMGENSALDQSISQLKGCGNGHDITLQGHASELKHKFNHDLIQFSIKLLPNGDCVPGGCPSPVKRLIRPHLEGIKPFGDNLQNIKNLTYDEFNTLRDTTPEMKDYRKDIDDKDLLADMFHAKKVKYINSKDYGLYHTKEDTLSFGVTKLQALCTLRIRYKVRNKKIKNGKCSVSIMGSCCPRKMSELPKSQYSLGSPARLPLKMKRLAGTPMPVFSPFKKRS